MFTFAFFFFIAAKERQQKREAIWNAKDNNNDATRSRTLSMNRVSKIDVETWGVHLLY